MMDDDERRKVMAIAHRWANKMTIRHILTFLVNNWHFYHFSSLSLCTTPTMLLISSCLWWQCCNSTWRSVYLREFTSWTSSQSAFFMAFSSSVFTCSNSWRRVVLRLLFSFSFHNSILTLTRSIGLFPRLK